MTKARTNASASPAVGRNMIINGAMNVAQRSASVTGIGANYGGYFTCDRWRIYAQDGAGRLTMSQTADGPNGISANCIKLDCTTADTSIAAGEILLLKQTFEGQNLQRIGSGVVGAKQVTVSFYVKASAAFTFGCELDNADNTRQCTKLFATTTDWVRHEITFPADVDDGSSPFDDDNAASLALNFWLHAGATWTGGTLNTATFANNTNANRAAGIDSFFSSTDNNFFITGVQMEVGIATEFEQEDISTTLAKCQRYFQQLGGSYGAFDGMFSGNATGTDLLFVTTNSKITMRAAPTFTLGGGVSNHRYAQGGSDVQPTSIVADQVRLNSFTLKVAHNGQVTSGNGARLFNNGTDGFYNFDAEL